MSRAVRRVVAGVDGCRAGWAVALAPLAGHGTTELHVVDSFADVLALGPCAIAVDMPVGLPDAGPRACDVEARRRLGPRRASVFATPVRAVLHSTTYAEALAIARSVDGRGLSRQAFNLLPRMRDLDATIGPRDQRTVVEAHPELCFALLLGAPCTASKHTAEGRAQRLAAIRILHPDVDEHLARPRRGTAVDDVLDAYALTVTARRVAAGRCTRLGDGAHDRTGLRMQIVV